MRAIGSSAAPNAVTTKKTRLRGRSPYGARLEADAPFGHWRTQTFIAGLRVDELCAPWLLDGPMNRAAFDTYVETQLAPVLLPGDVVIADNLAAHKSAKAQALLKSQGRLDALPAALQPGPEPDRDGIFQTQDPSQTYGSPNFRRPYPSRR